MSYKHPHKKFRENKGWQINPKKVEEGKKEKIRIEIRQHTNRQQSHSWKALKFINSGEYHQKEKRESTNS